MSINAQNNAVSSCVSRKALNRAEKLNIRSTNVAASSKADLSRARDTMWETEWAEVGRNMTPASPSTYAAWITHATCGEKHVLTTPCLKKHPTFGLL